MDAAAHVLSDRHRRRLRDVWRSSGWPCRDSIEVDLLAAGLLERLLDDRGHETLRVSDQGVRMLSATLDRNRRARDPHEELVERVALAMHREGRLVWRGLSLRAAVDDDAGCVARPQLIADDSAAPPGAAVRWLAAMPDVFSIRQTTVEAYLEPLIHEVKVRRADLLADVRRPGKRAAYLALAGACWYVLKEGIGTADDVPPTCGVVLARADALDVLRPAPRRHVRLPLATWMALAKTSRCDFGDDAPQDGL
jgi:hypothetical protein